MDITNFSELGQLSPARRAIALAGGPASLARKLRNMGHQISMQAVCKWREKDEIPELRCRAVEEIVNGLVTRYELQPEVFGPPPKRPASVRS